MSNAFIPSVCLTLLLTVSCQREQTGTVIARVGNAELTYEEALAHCDTAKMPLDDQLRRYVAHWVNDEMIFQEAKKNGVDKWDDVQRKIRDARRQLTAEAYLRIAQGLWTKQVSLGPRCVGWPAHEVAALNAARIAGKTDEEIRALVLKLEAARKAAA